eukprot:bmy_08053T0
MELLVTSPPWRCHWSPLACQLLARARGWAAVPATSAPGSRPPGGRTAGRHCRCPGGAAERGSPKQRRCPALPATPRAPGPRLGAEDRTPPPTLQQPGAARHPGRLPTPEQIFENIKQEYSHYQKWSHSEVVLNQSKAYVSESLPPSAAHPAPSSPGSSWMKNDQSPFTLQQITFQIVLSLIKATDEANTLILFNVFNYSKIVLRPEIKTDPKTLRSMCQVLKPVTSLRDHSRELQNKESCDRNADNVEGLCDLLSY